MRPFSITLSVTLLLVLATGVPAAAQDQAKVDEFAPLLDHMITQVATIENAYGPSLAGVVAQTRRQEVYVQSITEFEAIASAAATSTDANSVRFAQLMEQARAIDPTSDDARPILNELMVRSVTAQCLGNGIGLGVVSAYILRSSSAFVADRGNFFYPGFDESSLTAEDYVRIYFAGFGMIVLLQMDGGTDQAIALYQNATELKPYFAQQLVFRAADMDMAGIPILQAVLFDPATEASYREFYYGVLAGKMLGPAGQFGNVLSFSDEWKTTVAGWVMEQITLSDRLSSRQHAPLYGVDFEQAQLGPESLLGLIGPLAESQVVSLIESSEVIKQVCGLEAVQWVNADTYPEYAARLFELAEPLTASDDFTLAVLALQVFELDSVYTGQPYDDARRARIATNIPALCALMTKALQSDAIDYLSTSAWLDIAAEGSLIDQLEGCMPMVARVIRSDWSRKQNGEEVPLPEGEINLLARFIPAHREYFESTSEAVLGFLDAELASGVVNPFRVWAYVHYLQAAKQAGTTLSDNWISSLTRLRAWVDTAQALVNGDELKSALDALLQ